VLDGLYSMIQKLTAIVKVAMVFLRCPPLLAV